MIDRRTAVRRLGVAGAGAGIGLGPSVLHATSGGGARVPVRTRSDDRAVDLVLANVSAWLPGTDGSASVVHGVSVRISGNQVVQVARGVISGGDQVDLEGCLLIPGLISGHTHVAGGSSTRGIIEGGRSYARPLTIVEEEFDDDELDALTEYNLAELLMSGCTAQVEMSLSLRQAESYARVAQRLGARGWVGGMVPGIGRLFPIWFGNDQDLIASEADTLAEIAANLTFASGLAELGDGMVLGMMTPHAADTHTVSTLEAIRAAAERLGTGVHTHLSQGARETETVRRRHGVTPTRWLADAGLMDGPFFGAHFTGPDWSTDPAILIAKGGIYSTCPSAGGAGGPDQPYPEALGAGIAVNVGIDTHGNDMIENVKLAVLQGQTRAALLTRFGASEPHRAPTTRDALRGCTTVPANALRRPDLGVIEVGATADLVALDLSGFLVGSGATSREPLNNLLYANGRSVRWSFVDGRPIVSDGAFVAGDPEAITRAGARTAQRIWDRLEAEGWFE